VSGDSCRTENQRISSRIKLTNLKNALIYPMDTENIEKIKQLNNAAKTLSNLVDKHTEKIKEPSCDKYALKFGGDDRFSVFSTKVFLDCHTGYYGSSSCSTFAYVDSKLAQQLLDYALNKNMRLILADMAECAKKKAATLEGAAKKELENMRKMIEEATSEKN